MGPAPARATDLDPLDQARAQLEGSRERYRLATARFQKALHEFKDGLVPSPEKEFALARALVEERAARAEFMAALAAFSDLVIHGKQPEQG